MDAVDGRLAGSLLGTMLGDSLGLPRENLSPRRAARLFGTEPRQCLAFGLGMTSDDTELACFAAQSLLASGGEEKAFARAFGWKLRWWLLSLPAGIGLATGRAMLKLWLGFPPSASGVWSAGNGPALRAPILGAWCPDDSRLPGLIEASTIVTHRDPRAADAALATARAAHYAARRGRGDFDRDALLDSLGQDFLRPVRAWRGARPEEVLAALGTPGGVGGFIEHTVAAALWAWLEDPFDFRAGMRRVLALGGDSDSVGAVFGGLCGALVGERDLPRDWLDAVLDFPRSPDWVARLGRRLERGGEEVPLAWPLYAFRTPLQWALVLGHGFRRLAPPY